jgi:hypothetical protein
LRVEGTMFLPEERKMTWGLEMAMREEMEDLEALAAEQKKKPKPLVEEWMTVPPERL